MCKDTDRHTVVCFVDQDTDIVFAVQNEEGMIGVIFDATSIIYNTSIHALNDNIRLFSLLGLVLCLS